MSPNDFDMEGALNDISSVAYDAREIARRAEAGAQQAINMAFNSMNNPGGHDEDGESALDKASQALASANDARGAARTAMSQTDTLRVDVDNLKGASSAQDSMIKIMQEEINDLNQVLSGYKDEMVMLKEFRLEVQIEMDRLRQGKPKQNTEGEWSDMADQTGQILDLQEDLKKALEFIRDFREVAIDTTDFRDPRWESIGARAVGLLQRHKMI